MKKVSELTRQELLEEACFKLDNSVSALNEWADKAKRGEIGQQDRSLEVIAIINQQAQAFITLAGLREESGTE